MNKDNLVCPHCSKALERWDPSPYTAWAHHLFFCNNNDCDYFIKGRAKICFEYEKNFAYRYCYDPKNGQELPIVAWCPGELSLLKGRCRSDGGQEGFEERQVAKK
jgi:hypothetical protein